MEIFNSSYLLKWRSLHSSCRTLRNLSGKQTRWANLKTFSSVKCLLSSDIFIDLSSSFFETELQRASEAPWVRKIGKTSNRENLVMTSPYERPWSVQTVGERGAFSYEPESYAVESSQYS